MEVDVSCFTYSEFIEVDKIPRVKAEDGTGIYTASETGDFNFTGTKGYEEAVNLAKHGWNSGIAEMKEVIDTLQIQGSLDVNYSITGAVVDVPAFLSGSPECMIEYVDNVERQKPLATFFIPLSYNAFVTTKEALKFAKNALKAVVEKNVNYDLKIVGFFSTKFDYIDEATFITLKEYDEPFVLNSFAFAVHPSFFRRIKFRYMETKGYITAGYGRTLKIDESILTHYADNKGKIFLFSSVGESPRVKEILVKAEKKKNKKTEEEYEDFPF